MRFAPSLRFLRRNSDHTTARVVDPADLGTAFGMEVSLEQLPMPPAYGQLESQRAHPPLDNPMAWVRRNRS
jgi:hypothetical protein